MASKWIVVIHGSSYDFFGVYSSPSHYLNQYWHIIDWILRKKFHWTFHQIIIIYYSRNEITFSNVVCKMSAIWPRLERKLWQTIVPDGASGNRYTGVQSLISFIEFIEAKYPLSYAGVPMTGGSRCQDNPVLMGWCNIWFGRETYSIGICQCWKIYSATGVFIAAERFCVSEWRYSVYSCIHPCEEKKRKLDIFSIAKYAFPFDFTL